MRASSWIVSLLLLAAACQTRSAGTTPIPNSQVNITLEELESVPDLTAYQAVERLRPMWLQRRVGTVLRQRFPQVFVDGLRHGDLDSLRRLSARDIRAIRFLSARDATTRYGTGYPGGVIEVLTKRGTRR